MRGRTPTPDRRPRPLSDVETRPLLTPRRAPRHVREAVPDDGSRVPVRGGRGGLFLYDAAASGAAHGLGTRVPQRRRRGVLLLLLRLEAAEELEARVLAGLEVEVPVADLGPARVGSHRPDRGRPFFRRVLAPRARGRLPRPPRIVVVVVSPARGGFDGHLAELPDPSHHHAQAVPGGSADCTRRGPARIL